jgi:hypothetical protein
MKSLIVILHNLVARKERRNLQILVQLLLAVALLVMVFTVQVLGSKSPTFQVATSSTSGRPMRGR